MTTRSLSKIRPLLVLGTAGLAAAIACSAPPDGAADSAAITSGVKPDNIQPCPTCTATPLQVFPSRFDFGAVGAFDDPMGGVRTGQIVLTAPKTGSLAAFPLSTLDGRLAVTSFVWPTGRLPPVYGSGPVSVVAGDALNVNITYTSDFTQAGGALSTSILLNNAGSSVLVPVTVTADVLYPATPILAVEVKETCANYGADNAIQLGYATSPCSRGGNLFEFNISIENIGGVSATYTLPTGTGIGPFGLSCSSFTGKTYSIAPGAATTIACEGDVNQPRSGIFTASAGQTFPVTVPTSAGTKSFSFAVDIDGSPASTGGSSSGGGSSSSSGGHAGSSSSGGGGGSSSGASACVPCYANCGTGCGSTPTNYCGADAQNAYNLELAANPGCDAYCGSDPADSSACNEGN